MKKLFLIATVLFVICGISSAQDRRVYSALSGNVSTWLTGTFTIDISVYSHEDHTPTPTAYGGPGDYVVFSGVLEGPGAISYYTEGWDASPITGDDVVDIRFVVWEEGVIDPIYYHVERGVTAVTAPPHTIVDFGFPDYSPPRCGTTSAPIGGTVCSPNALSSATWAEVKSTF